MTVDPVLMNIFMSVITILVCGIAIRIGWSWLQSGRVKTGEYYVTNQVCGERMEKCCINAVKTTLTDHIQKESGQDSRVDERLKNIEQKIQDARDDSSKIREEVGGIRSALDEMAGMFKGYLQRMSDDKKVSS